MDSEPRLSIVVHIGDDFEEEIPQLDELEGAAPALFRRVLIAGEDGTARQDAIALVRVLAGGAEAVTVAPAADLIVVGSAADAPAGRVTLDPAARALLEGAHCPVAIAPAGLAGSDDYDLRRIDVGIDGSREASAALKMAARLARAHDVRLRLVAVAEPRLDLPGAPSTADPRELERLGRHLANASDGLPGLWIETELREGLADQVIVGLAPQDDLLVLGSRAAYGEAGRIALGEVATRILNSASCPTLVVPAP